MLEEDIVIKTTRNNNERLLLFNILCVVMLPALFFGGNSKFITGIIVSLGFIAPINIINYAYNWLPRPKMALHFMLLCAAPFAAGLAITAAGLLNRGIEAINLGGYMYFQIAKTSPNMPSNFCDEPLVAISSELVGLVSFLAGLSIFMITDSRYVIRKILLYCGASASVLMLLGSLILFMWNFEGSMFAESRLNYFSTFSDAAQWAAFGIIWMGASLAMAVFSSQSFRMLSFVYSARFLALAVAAVLFAGVMAAGKPSHQLAGQFVAAAALSFMAFDLAPIELNARRHELLRRISSHKKRLAKMRLPFLIYASAAALLWVLAYGNAAKMCQDSRAVFADAGNPNSITYAEKMSLMEDSLKMIDDKHLIFGYGTASFPSAFAFFQGSDLGSQPWPSPHSDLLHKIIENGLVGLALSSITFAFFLVRWLCKRSFSKAGFVMLAAVLAILALAAVEIPLQSPAVLASFWVLSMSMFRWDDAKVG